MYLWFIEDLPRLSRERTAIKQLEETSAWLVGTEWLFDGDARLCLDAVIRAHGHDYQVRMIYPNLFPSVPPTVRPLNAQGRWTGHQYGGNDGPLCLQWGPDNWHPELTGAQMLESTYSLLERENPQGEDRPEVAIPVPSRHQLTIGQEVRGSDLRFYVGKQLTERFKVLPKGCLGAFKFSLRAQDSKLRILVHEIKPYGEDSAFVDISIPKYLRGAKGDDADLRAGVFFKTDLPSQFIEGLSGLAAVEELLCQAGFSIDVFSQEESFDRIRLGLEQRPLGVIILDSAGDPHFFALLPDEGTLEFTFVRPSANAQVTRTPDSYRDLNSKSVGIVGAGSIGGKIALTLARMGIGRIYLADYDVFLPENVERHVLNWRNVGDHKVDALQELLSLTSSNIEIRVSRMHLTGQESTALVSGALNDLVRCDLIIDATADAQVFNLLTAVANAAEKPMVWTEVYAGGTGGMIARSRPGCDPDPHTMRAVYNQYCLENPAPHLKILGDYSAENSEGDVLAASDADVAIIAHHAARFAADTILSSDNSSYPYSMYLVGLTRWWVFSDPFHTIPIATDGFRREKEEGKEASEDDSAGAQFIADLLRKRSNATSSSS